MKLRSSVWREWICANAVCPETHCIEDYIFNPDMNFNGLAKTAISPGNTFILCVIYHLFKYSNYILLVDKLHGV